MSTPHTTIVCSGIHRIADCDVAVTLPKAHTAERPSPWIVFLHGRGHTSFDTHNFFTPEFAVFRAQCAERGIVVVCPAYGEACWMNEEAESCVQRVIEQVQTQLPLQDEFALMGVSMGGGAALTFAAHHPEGIRAVCDIMGVTDFARFHREGHYCDSLCAAFGGTPDEVPDVYRDRSSLFAVDTLKHIPILIIHGATDTTVPLWNSECLFEQLQTAGGHVEFVRVPNIGHGNIVVQGLDEKIMAFPAQNGNGTTTHCGSREGEDIRSWVLV